MVAGIKKRWSFFAQGPLNPFDASFRDQVISTKVDLQARKAWFWKLLVCNSIRTEGLALLGMVQLLPVSHSAKHLFRSHIGNCFLKIIKLKLNFTDQSRLWTLNPAADLTKPCMPDYGDTTCEFCPSAMHYIYLYILFFLYNL